METLETFEADAAWSLACIQSVQDTREHQRKTRKAERKAVRTALGSLRVLVSVDVANKPVCSPVWRWCIEESKLLLERADVHAVMIGVGAWQINVFPVMDGRICYESSKPGHLGTIDGPVPHISGDVSTHSGRYVMPDTIWWGANLTCDACRQLAKLLVFHWTEIEMAAVVGRIVGDRIKFHWFGRCKESYSLSQFCHSRESTWVCVRIPPKE